MKKKHSYCEMKLKCTGFNPAFIKCQSEFGNSHNCYTEAPRPQDSSGSAEFNCSVTDMDRLNWLAERCYLPGDHPDDGILVVVSEKYSPMGSFSCNQANDREALRAAIDKAMNE